MNLKKNLKSHEYKNLFHISVLLSNVMISHESKQSELVKFEKGTQVRLEQDFVFSALGNKKNGNNAAMLRSNEAQIYIYIYIYIYIKVYKSLHALCLYCYIMQKVMRVSKFHRFRKHFDSTWDANMVDLS